MEILTDTGLQRMLDEDVFGRAYGLALPASLAGIVAGSLVAPLLTDVLGGSGALIALGLVVLAYALFLLRRAPARAAARQAAPRLVPSPRPGPGRPAVRPVPAEAGPCRARPQP